MGAFSLILSGCCFEIRQLKSAQVDKLWPAHLPENFGTLQKKKLHYLFKLGGLKSAKNLTGI